MSENASIAIIGGSGLYSLRGEGVRGSVRDFSTPYSAVPIRLQLENIDDKQIWFFARHGKDHSIPPHKINSRANLWALKEAGVKRIIAVNAVGGISSKMSPGQLVIPDQIIDYTYGHDQTYYDGLSSLHNHINFTFPYNQKLGSCLAGICVKLGLSVIDSATYGCTQGPRLETAAEIIKLKQDGCDIVGMTGMPEAALARELDMDYVCFARVVNWAAGIAKEAITMDDIHRVLEEGLVDIRRVLLATLSELA